MIRMMKSEFVLKSNWYLFSKMVSQWNGIHMQSMNPRNYLASWRCISSFQNIEGLLMEFSCNGSKLPSNNPKLLCWGDRKWKPKESNCNLALVVHLWMTERTMMFLHQQSRSFSSYVWLPSTNNHPIDQDRAKRNDAVHFVFIMVTHSVTAQSASSSTRF